MNRVLRDIRTDESNNSLEFQNIMPTMRWIPCSICTNRCFRSRDHSILSEICKSCARGLHIRFIQYCVSRLEKSHVQHQKRQMHEELMHVCYRPEYVFKTGSIETYGMFNHDN
jgi:hypothetical protein